MSKIVVDRLPSYGQECIAIKLSGNDLSCNNEDCPRRLSNIYKHTEECEHLVELGKIINHFTEWK